MFIECPKLPGEWADEVGVRFMMTVFGDDCDPDGGDGGAVGCPLPGRWWRQEGR